MIRHANARPSITASRELGASIGGLITMLNGEAWMREGACRQFEADTMYPKTPTETAHAKAVCGHCPVQRECLDYALARDERYGIWGGMTIKGRLREIERRLTVTT